MLSLLPAVMMPLACGGCALGQAQVDVSTQNTATLYGIPRVPGLTALATDDVAALEGEAHTSVTFDVHQVIDTLGSYGDLSATVTRDALSGPGLARIHRIRISIGNVDGANPDQPLSDVTVPAGAIVVD